MMAIFQDIGWPEIVIILGLALLLFGAKRLPEIGKGMGKGIREFKDAVKGVGDDVKTGLDDKPAQQPAPSPPPAPKDESGSGQPGS